MKKYKQKITGEINRLYELTEKSPANAGEYKVQINQLLHKLYITWFSLSKRELYKNI